MSEVRLLRHDVDGATVSVTARSSREDVTVTWKEIVRGAPYPRKWQHSLLTIIDRRAKSEDLKNYCRQQLANL